MQRPQHFNLFQQMHAPMQCTPLVRCHHPHKTPLDSQSFHYVPFYEPSCMYLFANLCFNFSWVKSRDEIARLQARGMLNFLKHYETASLSACTLWHSHQQVSKNSSSLTFSPTYGIVHHSRGYGSISVWFLFAFTWRLMVVRFFSHAWWPFVYLPLCNIC